MSIDTQQQQAEKVREDLNRSRLKQDGQDFQDAQDEGEKVWKTLMSIARRRNKEKRSVRTLIAIDTLEPIVFGGEQLPRGEGLSS